MTIVNDPETSTGTIVDSNKTIYWFIIFAIIYIAAFAVLTVVYGFSFNDLLINFISFGFGLSFTAWLLVKNIRASRAQPAFKNETLILFLLVAWIILYITYGGDFINSLLSKNLQSNEQWQFFIIIARKLLVFVLIPYFVYRVFVFSLKYFGLRLSVKQIFSKRNILVLVVMSIVILLLQYFLSGGAKPLRDGQFSRSQLFIALPLTFVWMFIEAGVIEEFFFRAILQTRLAALLKSEWGAIFIGGLLFALAHVPGLYLRSAESEGVTEQMPLWFWLSYCLVNMSIAGIFLGIIWSRTKNLYIVMALHAITDLLPNTPDFIRVWHV